MRKFPIFIFIVIFYSTVFPQKIDALYSLSAQLGAGYSRYFTTLNNPELNKNGFIGTLRVMWNPEHLLSIGLESGYHYLYSINISDYDTEYGRTNYSASMYSVPIFMTFEMKVWDNIKLLGSSGVYLLYNSGKIFGEELRSSQISIGAQSGINYTYQINENYSIGGELKYSLISKIEDHTINLQFFLVYDFFKW